MIDARRRTIIEEAAVMPAFPYFVGCGRSGTTLLRAMFDSHPLMTVPVETQFILTMAERRRRYESAVGFRVEPFLADLYRYTDLSVAWDLSPEDLRSELVAAPPKDYPSAVRQVFAIQARRTGKPRYANKTPIHVLNLTSLSQLFPEAVFVHIIRDGRDVALSFLESSFGPETVESAALRWRRYVRRGRKAGRRLGAARYREVRYEDLVQRPRQVAEALCDFVGLEFDEVMLSYFERADELLNGIGFPESHEHLRLPPTVGLREWRSQMPSSQVERFEVLAGDLLSELGYPLVAGKPSRPVRMATRGRGVVEGTRRVGGAIARRLRKRVRPGSSQR